MQRQRLTQTHPVRQMRSLPRSPGEEEPTSPACLAPIASPLCHPAASQYRPLNGLHRPVAASAARSSVELAWPPRPECAASLSPSFPPPLGPSLPAAWFSPSACLHCLLPSLLADSVLFQRCRRSSVAVWMGVVTGRPPALALALPRFVASAVRYARLLAVCRPPAQWGVRRRRIAAASVGRRR